MIDLCPDHLKRVLKILAEHLPDHTVWAYGSRATSIAKPTSDLDLAIKTDTPLPFSKLADLAEAFSESDLPFKVDLTDWAATSPSFQQIIQSTHQVIRLGGTPTDAILVLLDVVDYTPQAREQGGQKTKAFDQYIAEEMKTRATLHGFHFIKSIGDAALLWGESPHGLVAFILDLFRDHPILPKDGFTPGFRMLAHKDYFQFSRNEQGVVVEVHGMEAILLFRLEKTAYLNRIIVTNHLFGGIRPFLEEAEITFQKIELIEELKGLAYDSPRQVYLLAPPLAKQVEEMAYPDAYRHQREILRKEVQFIPIFGQLYPPIPMQENFLVLTLNAHQTHQRAGHHLWDRPEMSGHFEIAKDQAPEKLTVDALFTDHSIAVIAGLPGAGKTTIMRHFAWYAFEKDPYSLVILVEAKYLCEEHCKDQGGNDIDIFSLLATLFLFAGKNPHDLSNREQDHIKKTAAMLKTGWAEGRAIILIDALDEAPTLTLRRWLASHANALICQLTKEASTDAPPQSRCYLSLRVAEMEEYALADAPVFLVNPLNMEQIRGIARRRLNESSPLYAKFDTEIWQRTDIQKIAGTPLTAMLMVFFYELYGRFDRPYATYRLMVLFILDRAWERMKADQFYLPRQGLNPFFQDVRRDDFMENRPEFKMQYTVLAYAASRFLYNRREGKSEQSERAIHRKELFDFLTEGCRRLGFQPKAGYQNDWINAWRRENLLLPAGPHHFVFPHSTVLEFLAAVDIGEMLKKPIAYVNDIKNIFENRGFDPLETLPLLCSESCEQGWTVLDRLGKEKIDKKSLLPFRCLAATEAAEKDEIEIYTDKNLYEKKENEVNTRPEKKWAYEHLAHWVLGEKGIDEAAQLTWLGERFKAIDDAMAIPLCRSVLVKKYLSEWRHDDTPIPREQGRLLKRMLTDESWEDAFPKTAT